MPDNRVITFYENVLTRLSSRATVSTWPHGSDLSTLHETLEFHRLPLHSSSAVVAQTRSLRQPKRRFTRPLEALATLVQSLALPGNPVPRGQSAFSTPLPWTASSSDSNCTRARASKKKVSTWYRSRCASVTNSRSSTHCRAGSTTAPASPAIQLAPRP